MIAQMLRWKWIELVLVREDAFTASDSSSVEEIQAPKEPNKLLSATGKGVQWKVPTSFSTECHKARSASVVPLSDRKDKSQKQPKSSTSCTSSGIPGTGGSQQ